jgi:hypothetical protein
LAFNDGGVLNHDGFLEFGLINDDALVSAEDIETNFIITIPVHANVESCEDCEFLLKHFGGDAVLDEVDVGITFLQLVV